MTTPRPISIFSAILLFGFLIWICCNPNEPLSPQSAEEDQIIRHVENITTYETWESNKTHIIATAISIENAVLRIKPGTTIQLEQAASISINNRAGFIADGSDKPIIFTSSNSKKGSWNYIFFADGAQDDSCRLSHCQFKYGGGDLTRGAVIHCENISPTITGCTIDSSLSSGVNLIGDCRDIQFYDNKISNCEYVPIQTYANNVASIGSNNYQDNGIEQIRIIDGNITSDATWQNLSIPFRIADGLKIKNAKLIIKPSVKLLFDYDEGVTVSEGASLEAVGTPSELIIFDRGWNGPWRDIHFTPSANDVESKLIYCEIEYGGQDGNFPANLILEDASPEISNCFIRHSHGYGVYFSGKIKPGRFDNNTITKNALAPISVPANAVFGLGTGTYSGNGSDVIEVRANFLEQPIQMNGHWLNLGVPYRIQGTVQIQSSTLIFAPGVNIQMAERSGFEILVNGGLIADGTENLISIEGSQPIIGIWNHIYFSNFANANNCQLINCRIRYGGGDLNRPGMIVCDNVSPIIRNCVIENSQTYGIYTTGVANISDLQSNIFSGNVYGDFFKSP